METPPASSPLPKLIATSGQKNSHMTLHPSSQGHRRAVVGKKKGNRKAPSVTGGAQKILVRGIQRTRNLIGSPAQGGLPKGGHNGRAIKTAHNHLPNAAWFSHVSRGIKAGRPSTRVTIFRQFNSMALVVGGGRRNHWAASQTNQALFAARPSANCPTGPSA
jgi:hypothetical protein